MTQQLQCVRQVPPERVGEEVGTPVLPLAPVWPVPPVTPADKAGCQSAVLATIPHVRPHTHP